MRRGATLIELVLVLCIMGVVAAFAMPGFGALRDRLAVEEAAAAIASAHTRARVVALAEGRIAVLTLSLDSLVVRAVESSVDTIERWRGPGPGAEGVSASGLPRTLTLAPSGVPIGVANGTYLLRRGAARRQVVVSRYGRLRIF